METDMGLYMEYILTYSVEMLPMMSLSLQPYGPT